MDLCGPGSRATTRCIQSFPAPRGPSPGQREPLSGVGVRAWALTTVGLRSLAGEEGGQMRIREQSCPSTESPGPGKALERPSSSPSPEPNKGGSLSDMSHLHDLQD